MQLQDGGQFLFLLFFLVFGRSFAACSETNHQGQTEIDVERLQPKHHSGIKNPNDFTNSKADMSKQSNKVQKRARRKAYLKRRNTRVKAKKPAAAAPAA